MEPDRTPTPRPLAPQPAAPQPMEPRCAQAESGAGAARAGGLREAWPALLAAALLALWTWARIDGYALADSVEYLEHAQALVRGERVLDSSDIRGIGFALVLAPPFLVAEWLGIEDLRWVMPFARGLQLLFTLLLVLGAVRIGSILAGRGAGLAAGFIAATSPVLATFSVEPVADVLATLLLTRALLCALEPGPARRNLYLGLWLGAALLVAFKSLLVAGPLATIVLLRDLRGRRRAAGALLLGLMIGVSVQLVLDRLRYGEWGRSLGFYLGANGYGIGARIAGELGFVELARSLYELGKELHTGEEHSAAAAVMGDVRQRAPVGFYFLEATRFVALPGLALAALGALRALLRPNWARVQPLVLVALAALITTYKGSKDFRLWLPLLPAVAALCALGFGWVQGRPCNSGPLRRGLALALLLLNGALALPHLGAGPSPRHGGYWDALDHVQREAERLGQPLRTSAAWHWALFLREGPPVELIKLPHHLEGWQSYDEARRARDLEVLAGLDRFIVHLAVLTERPSLLAALNDLFAVEALFFDGARYRDLGPILVLARRRLPAEEAGERTLFDLLPGAEPDSYSARQGLGPAWDFLGLGGAGGRLRLLGFEVEPLPGGHSWLTLHWWVEGALADDVLVLARIETEPAGAVYEELHQPLWGQQPSSAWAAGTLLREGRPLVAAAKPFDPGAPWLPLGAAGAGPTLDAELLLAVFAPPSAGDTAARVLAPARPGSAAPLDPAQAPDAALLDPSGRLRVGRFPLHPLEPTREPAGP